MSPAEALFVACLISGVLVPFPEDVPLLLAGLAVSRGELTAPTAFLAGFLGTFARDATLFALGHFAGPRLQALLERLLGERLGRAMDRFESRTQGEQDVLVFATRFAAGMRGPLYLVAGLLDVTPRRFAVLDLVGLVLYVPLVLWLGSRYGETAASGFQEVLANQRPVFGLLVAGGLSVWLFRRVRRARAAG